MPLYLGRLVKERSMYLYIVGAIALVTFFFLIEGRQLRVFVLDLREDMMMTFFPSAQRAYAYAKVHFDASDSNEYDLDRAERLFQFAAAHDSSLPYLYHELARIEFLKGNFTQALALIDMQIEMHGDSEPAAYYVRGLIEGYMGSYENAAADYTKFLKFDPHNWAALNDRAWVLLKAKRYSEALDTANTGLAVVPENAWLLNSKATALYELGRYKEALTAGQKASSAVALVTPEQWETAYPGNDPAVAADGLASFRRVVADNMHSIELALSERRVLSE